MERTLKIRITTDADIETVLHIHNKAFGEEKGPEIASLVAGLLSDPTAMPLLSLTAIDNNNNKAIGHILYTKARLYPIHRTVSVQILAPLAVLPEAQSEGVGGQLIKEGLRLLKEAGIELVFVLGYPNYYSRYGFKTAGKLGYEAPYPIPEEHADAWMVQELCAGVIGSVAGRVQCSDVLNQPRHWRE
jgi:putative acetyltransferase